MRLLSRLIPILGIAVLGLASGFGGLQRVSAHASYASSNPSDKQVLPTAPTQLAISFVSDIVPSPGTFATVTCNGSDAASGPGQPSPTDPMTLVVPLMPNLPSPAQCVVFWKSTDADDGGVTFGRFSFFIGNVSPADVAAAQAGASVAVPDDAKDMALTNVPMGPAAAAGTPSSPAQVGTSMAPAASVTPALAATATSNATPATSATMTMPAASMPATGTCSLYDSMCVYCQNHPSSDLCPETHS